MFVAAAPAPATVTASGSVSAAIAAIDDEGPKMKRACMEETIRNREAVRQDKFAEAIVVLQKMGKVPTKPRTGAF